MHTYRNLIQWLFNTKMHSLSYDYTYALYTVIHTSSSSFSLVSVRCYRIHKEGSIIIRAVHTLVDTCMHNVEELITSVFRVRRISNRALSLSLLRCLASSPSPPWETPSLAVFKWLHNSSYQLCNNRLENNPAPSQQHLQLNGQKIQKGMES